jgi:hypothetical protein
MEKSYSDEELALRLSFLPEALMLKSSPLAVSNRALHNELK